MVSNILQATVVIMLIRKYLERLLYSGFYRSPQSWTCRFLNVPVQMSQTHFLTSHTFNVLIQLILLKTSLISTVKVWMSSTWLGVSHLYPAQRVLNCFFFFFVKKMAFFQVCFFLSFPPLLAIWHVWSILQCKLITWNFESPIPCA